MVFQNVLHIGLLKIIGMHMEFMHVMDILFNHESPIRGETFVTKKIIQGLVKN